MFPSYKLIWENKKSVKREYRYNNTVNDLRYKIKFENHVKDKNKFFIKSNIAFLLEKKYFILGDIFFLKFLRI